MQIIHSQADILLNFNVSLTVKRTFTFSPHQADIRNPLRYLPIAILVNNAFERFAIIRSNHGNVYQCS